MAAGCAGGGGTLIARSVAGPRRAGATKNSALHTLQNFFEARNGATEPFYSYDPSDADPECSYDPTGVATVGRYTVRFNGDWQQSPGLRRSDVGIELIEVS